jgi:hypothetical protein
MKAGYRGMGESRCIGSLGVSLSLGLEGRSYLHESFHGL